MPAPTQTKQKITATESIPTPKCVVTEGPDGTLVTFKIDPQDWARLQRRMGPQDPATYMWENHLYRMIMGAVY